MMIASTGGHLAQLHRLSRRFQLTESPTWVTFESEQSKSLLEGERVHFVPYVAPRDWRAAYTAGRIISGIVRRERFDVGVSTGAALAVAGLPPIRLAGGRAVYIESVSRFRGPSLSGRIVQRLPGVELYTQHPEWESRRWRHEFTVLDEYQVLMDKPLPERPLRVFVTLGTIKPYRFDALVDTLAPLADLVDFAWQVGVTERNDLPGEVHSWMGAHDFAARLAWADVVVSHAGVGTALQLLDSGIRPVLVPRRSARGEHVDDHQEQIAEHLAGKRLSLLREADDLSYADLLEAARSRIVVGDA